MEKRDSYLSPSTKIIRIGGFTAKIIRIGCCTAKSGRRVTKNGSGRRGLNQCFRQTQ